MMTIRKSAERGMTKTDWLTGHHSFSFGDYFDPDRMGFRRLRVINEDFVAQDKGFPQHSHSDMEILTYIIDGGLEHKDSIGTGSTIKAGEIQRMSAGKGITHSEFNASKNGPVHLLQIWIEPERRGLKPQYEQNKIPDNQNEWIVLASRQGGAVKIYADVTLSLIRLSEKKKAEYLIEKGRYAYVQIVRGKVSCNGTVLEAGDAAELSDEQKAEFEAKNDAEILVFDLG